MSFTKPELREMLKSKRLTMSDDERAVKSAAIRQRLRDDVDWTRIKTAHSFESINELNEVDISGVFTGIQLFTSRKIEGHWQVVPAEGDTAVPDQFDVIIVPMLGFDTNLHRIGYGGGYYDKFLATQLHAQKIGVCFEIGKVESIPAEVHDVSLDVIFTEEYSYKY